MAKPIHGFLQFSPEFLRQLDYPIQFAIAHTVWYGLVIGLFTQGEPGARQYGFLIIVFTALFALWEHPMLHFVHEEISNLQGQLLSAIVPTTFPRIS